MKLAIEPWMQQLSCNHALRALRILRTTSPCVKCNAPSVLHQRYTIQRADWSGATFLTEITSGGLRTKTRARPPINARCNKNTASTPKTKDLCHCSDSVAQNIHDMSKLVQEIQSPRPDCMVQLWWRALLCLQPRPPSETMPAGCHRPQPPQGISVTRRLKLKGENVRNSLKTWTWLLLYLQHHRVKIRLCLWLISRARAVTMRRVGHGSEQVELGSALEVD